MAIENNIDTSLMTVGSPTDGGCIYANFTDNSVPTDATTEMSTLANFKSLGDVSGNGFTESRSISTTNHKDWGGYVVMVSMDGDEITFKVELLEVNRIEAAKARYGDDAVTAGEDGSVSKIEYKPFKLKGYPVVIDELETSGYKRRTVIKSATVTSVDDVPHQKGSLMVYGMTLTATKPSDGTDPVVVYRAKPVA